MALMKRKYLWEADDDDTGGNASGSDSGDTGSDAADDGGETSNDSGDSEEEGSGEEDENIDGDQNEEEGEEDNFDIDSEEDAEEEEGEGNDGNSDDSGGDDAGLGDSSEDTDSEEKQMDRDMFETLSDAEKKQKIKTLKGLFLELYNRCENIIEHYDSAIDKYESITPIARRVILTLYDLKKYIADYTINLFDSKSYIENDVMYNRCLSVLNGIKMVTKDVVKMVENEEK